MNKRTLKAQSAMEYLMTYGWAILIIAVVLGALFSLGVFTPGVGLGNSCIAYSGFLCSSMIYSHTGGILSMVVGQSTGTNWGNVIVMFAIQGTGTGTTGPAPGVSGTTNSGAANVINGGLVSGQTATVVLASQASTYTVGSTVAGALWVCYVTSASTTILTYATGTGACGGAGTNTIYYAQIATLTAKAV